jgi:hypothetical protein
MALNELPSEEQLAEELQHLCADIGYVATTARTKAMRRVPCLISLSIVGGPAEPTTILEWIDRREALRSVLREIAEQEVPKKLDEQYSEAATAIFRLRADKPLRPSEHLRLSEIQTPLDEKFGSPPGSKAFQDNYRPQLLAVVANALRAREVEARNGMSTIRDDPKSDDRSVDRESHSSAAPTRQSQPAKAASSRRGRAKSRKTKPSKPPQLRQQETHGSSTSIGQSPRRYESRQEGFRRRRAEARKAALEKRAKADSPAPPSTKNWTRLPDGVHEVAEAVVVFLAALLFLYLVGVLPE